MPEFLLCVGERMSAALLPLNGGGNKAKRAELANPRQKAALIQRAAKFEE
jgi:hypothetical protein